MTYLVLTAKMIFARSARHTLRGWTSGVRVYTEN